MRNGPHTGRTDAINISRIMEVSFLMLEKGVANTKRSKIKWIGIEGIRGTHGCQYRWFGK